jgi:hypothetical protein
MKKNLYFFAMIFLLSLSNNFIFAQNPPPLLNKEAYSFAVGDTFAYEVRYSKDPLEASTIIFSYYYEWVIKGLSNSVNQDTLYLKVVQRKYGVDTSKIKNRRLIVGLDSSVTKNLKLTLPGGQTYPFKDINYSETTETQYKNLGSAKKSTRQQLTANHNGGLFSFQIRYAEGIGMVYYHRNIGPGTVADGDYHHKETLVYFRNKKEKWGSYPKQLVDAKETTLNYSIALYPNPVQDLLFFKNTFDPLRTKYEIQDIQGNIVKKATTLSDNTISVEGLPKGMYILEISNNDNLYISKFIKE